MIIACSLQTSLNFFPDTSAVKHNELFNWHSDKWSLYDCENTSSNCWWQFTLKIPVNVFYAGIMSS